MAAPAEDVTDLMDRASAGGGLGSSPSGFVLTLTMLGLVLLLSAWAQLLPAGMTPDFLAAQKETFRTVWPQGWEFFASAADTPTVTAYSLRSDRAPGGAELALNMSGQNMWGLGRAATAQLDEILYLADRIPRGYWSSCTEPLARICLARERTYRLADNFQPELLCGLTAFVRAQPSAALPSSGVRSASVAVARLSCSG